MSFFQPTANYITKSHVNTDCLGCLLKVTDEMRDESSEKRMQAMDAMNEGLST